MTFSLTDRKEFFFSLRAELAHRFFINKGAAVFISVHADMEMKILPRTSFINEVKDHIFFLRRPFDSSSAIIWKSSRDSAFQTPAFPLLKWKLARVKAGKTTALAAAGGMGESKEQGIADKTDAAKESAFTRPISADKTTEGAQTSCHFFFSL